MIMEILMHIVCVQRVRILSLHKLRFPLLKEYED